MTEPSYPVDDVRPPYSWLSDTAVGRRVRYLADGVLGLVGRRLARTLERGTGEPIGWTVVDSRTPDAVWVKRRIGHVVDQRGRCVVCGERNHPTDPCNVERSYGPSELMR